jgi:plastocyanin
VRSSADLQVKVGDSVKFNNDDTVAHAVLKGPHENLGQIKPGDANRSA